MDETIIAVDAMGGDDAPGVVTDGVAAALEADPSLHVILTGPDEVVTPFADAHERARAQVASEVIGMDEHGATAVRKKRDSSVNVGCRLVRDGEAQGFFSAGSTGACMAAATLVMGRIKGIKRPAIVTALPTPTGMTVMCDLGANADCRAEYLVQFAYMGRVFAQAVLGIDEPQVGLLNIGSEETKGSAFAQECHAAMRESVPGFAGNAEGDDIALGGFDVIVTDGFTGNVALKVYEGTAKGLMKSLSAALTSTTRAKVGALFAKGAIKELAASMSAEELGGAQLLGVKGVCLIGHGNSSAKAIASGVAATARAVRADLPGRLAAELDAHTSRAGR